MTSSGNYWELGTVWRVVIWGTFCDVYYGQFIKCYQSEGDFFCVCVWWDVLTNRRRSDGCSDETVNFFSHLVSSFSLQWRYSAALWMTLRRLRQARRHYRDRIVFFSPQLFAPHAHSLYCNLNFPDIFARGLSIDLLCLFGFFFFFTIIRNRAKDKLSGKKKSKTAFYLKWAFVLLLKYQWVCRKMFAISFGLICILAPKPPPITSCSCRVIVAGFINKTFSRLSFLHFFPKPVIIFNDKGAAWPQENLMTKATRLLLPSSSNAV